MKTKLLEEININDIKNITNFKKKFLEESKKQINDSANQYTSSHYNFSSFVSNYWWNNNIGMELIVQSKEHSNLQLYLNTGIYNDGNLFFSNDNGDDYVPNKLMPFMHEYLFRMAFNDLFLELEQKYFKFIIKNDLTYINDELAGKLLHKKMYNIVMLWDNEELYTLFMSLKENEINWNQVKDIYIENISNHSFLSIYLYAKKNISKEEALDLIEDFYSEIKNINLPIQKFNIKILTGNIPPKFIYINNLGLIAQKEFHVGLNDEEN